jgi:hypothetical protein
MLKRQLRKMERLLKTRVITREDPAIVGLLCAWATGHYGALAVLADYLAATGHAQAAAVARLSSDEVAAAAGLLVLPPANQTAGRNPPCGLRLGAGKPSGARRLTSRKWCRGCCRPR